MIKFLGGITILGFLLAATFAQAKEASDLYLLKQARKLYSQNKLEDSIATYNQISKESDFWVDAQEEKAWAYTRMNEYGKAMAELKSVLSPFFIQYASSEAIMLAAFIDLKVCNYKGVAEKIPLFKQTMLPRVEALEEIVENPNSEFIKGWIEKAQKSQLKLSDLGQNVVRLPRLFHRQKVLTPQKMKSLAQTELKEISKNLKKMKIIEIELIHRTQIKDVKLAEGKNLKFDKKNSKDVLIFPVKEGSQEIWLDEIGKFEVQTTQCPGSQSL
jgi:hypothetical protein